MLPNRSCSVTPDEVSAVVRHALVDDIGRHTAGSVGLPLASSRQALRSLQPPPLSSSALIIVGQQQIAIVNSFSSHRGGSEVPHSRAPMCSVLAYLTFIYSSNLGSNGESTRWIEKEDRARCSQKKKVRDNAGGLLDLGTPSVDPFCCSSYAECMNNPPGSNLVDSAWPHQKSEGVNKIHDFEDKAMLLLIQEAACVLWLQ